MNRSSKMVLATLTALSVSVALAGPAQARAWTPGHKSTVRSLGVKLCCPPGNSATPNMTRIYVQIEASWGSGGRLKDTDVNAWVDDSGWAMAAGWNSDILSVYRRTTCLHRCAEVWIVEGRSRDCVAYYTNICPIKAKWHIWVFIGAPLNSGTLTADFKRTYYPDEHASTWLDPASKWRAER